MIDVFPVSSGTPRGTSGTRLAALPVELLLDLITSSRAPATSQQREGKDSPLLPHLPLTVSQTGLVGLQVELWW